MAQQLGIDEGAGAEKKKKAKTHKIGSIKNDKINYPPDQKFFHSSDVPENVKKITSTVKDEIDKDILGIK